MFTKTFKIIQTNTGIEIEDEHIKKIKSSEAFIKSIRTMAHGTSILTATNSFDFHNWRISYNAKGYNFCSYNPIIVKDDTAKNILDTDFIIPLTKNHELVRTLKTVPIKSTSPILGFNSTLTWNLLGLFHSNRVLNLGNNRLTIFKASLQSFSELACTEITYSLLYFISCAFISK